MRRVKMYVWGKVPVHLTLTSADHAKVLASAFGKAEFVKPIQPDLPSPPLPAKISRFTFSPNQQHLPLRPTPTEGRIMIVTYAGWDAVDAAASGARGDRRAGFP